MNKVSFLGIVTLVCAAASTHAGLNKNDLEKAIRALDVDTVRQIVTTEKFTQKESERYLDLASQMINDHKFTVKGSLLKRDALTSCDKTAVDKAELEQIGGAALILTSSKILADLQFQKTFRDAHPDSGTVLIASALLATGIALFVKSYFTFNNYLNKELRSKRDAAITIKQLIYSAHVE